VIGWVLLLAGLASLEAEVARLGAARPAVRRHARARLEAAGGRAVPALHEGLNAADPEVRREAAALLDRLFDKSLAAGRRNRPYTVPRTKATRQVRRWRNFPAQLLARPGFVQAFGERYVGVLAQWKSPSLADYDGLLRTLGGYLRRIPGAGPDGLEAFFAARAIVAQLNGYAPGLGRTHWTTRWAVRRELLPALRELLRARGAALTRAEADLCQRLCDHVRCLCDEPSVRVHKRLVALLARTSRT
jgi:hypothetical protein